MKIYQMINGFKLDMHLRQISVDKDIALEILSSNTILFGHMTESECVFDEQVLREIIFDLPVSFPFQWVYML